MGCEYGKHGQRQMKACTNWKQDKKGGGGVSMPTKMGENLSTRDEQTKRAASMENMNEEG